MALDVLVQGRLAKAPEQRTASNGNEYCVAQLSVAQGDEGSILANVIAFRASAVDALLLFAAGDSCAISGAAKLGVWTNRDGEARVSLSITAEVVLTVYAARAKRRAAQGDDNEPDVPNHQLARDRAVARLPASPQPASDVGGISEMLDDLPF
jgi:single-stranded DNA-binding protein